MTNWLNHIYHIGRHQARNLINLVSGLPVMTPPLGSVTLDMDDVDIAKVWLKDRSRWKDNSVVADYENRFAAWNGSHHAFAFMGGRVALSACIYALGLQAGDEVILPGYTCVVVANAFHYAGVTTVYSDIELDTYGLDVAQLEEKITSNTRAIMVQHLYGLVCRDFEAILELAKHHHIKVIEDCAHSTGAEFRGRKVGNFGDCAFYSSEQSKVFTTIQGGIAITNDDKLAGKIKEYSEQAPFPDDEFIEKLLCNVLINFYRNKHPNRWLIGDLVSLRYANKSLVSTSEEEEQGIQPVNYGRKMPAPVAALGINQIQKIDGYNHKRRLTAERWGEWCRENQYRTPTVIPNSIPVFLRYPVLVEPDKKLNRVWAHRTLGVQIGVWFVSHLHPANFKVAGCPNADIAVKQCINFPGII